MIVELEPNSFDWEMWRGAGIGGSDAPIIIGDSPYKTALQLWNEKVNGAVQQEKFVFQRGHELEEKARPLFNKKYGMDMKPAMFQSDSIDYIRASLDGYCDKGIWEGKFTGKENLELVRKTQSPISHHYAQLQHQLFVSEATCAYYSVYTAKGSNITDMETVLVLRDEPYIEMLIEQEIIFWKSVLNEKQPVPCADDSVLVTEDKLILALSEYRSIYEQLKVLEETKDLLKKQIFQDITHPKMTYEDMTITQSTTKGRIDYKSIPEVKGVDVDLYRLPDTVRETISFKKQKD